MEGESTVKTLPFNGRREKVERVERSKQRPYALKKEFSRLLSKEVTIPDEKCAG